MSECVHLCCGEHLVRCFNETEQPCQTCGEAFCTPHLDGHSCEWQRALRAMPDPAPEFVYIEPEAPATSLMPISLPPFTETVPAGDVPDEFRETFDRVAFVGVEKHDLISGQHTVSSWTCS